MELFAEERHVVGDGAAHVLDRRHPAQHLLDRDRQLAGVLGEQLQLIGVEQELFHAAADHAGLFSSPPMRISSDS